MCIYFGSARLGSAELGVCTREAFNYLDEAIRMEGRMNRIAIDSFMTLFSGTSNYLVQGGVITSRSIEILESHMENAETLFGYESRLLLLIRQLRDKITQY